MNPKEFQENVTTVKQAIEALQKLNPNTPVDLDGEGRGVDICLFNRLRPNEHVSFEPGGLWTRK